MKIYDIIKVIGSAVYFGIILSLTIQISRTSYLVLRRRFAPPVPSSSSSRRHATSYRSTFDTRIQMPESSKHFQVRRDKPGEFAFAARDISDRPSVTMMARRLESSQNSPSSGQFRQGMDGHENVKKFPSPEPSSYLCGGPTFQRVWHQSKPTGNSPNHFYGHPNQVRSGSMLFNHRSTESTAMSYRPSGSPAGETFHSNPQSSPHSIPNASSEYNRVDCKTEDASKKRFSSYLKFHLGGGKEEPRRNYGLVQFHNRSLRQGSPGTVENLHLTRSSQSPEPPPRLNRLPPQCQEPASPLPLKRGFLDHSPARKQGLVEGSPSLSRRYVSPSPPQPPPRRLSECNSVPNSPQHRGVEHYRTRFHYTPEPQRRLFRPEF